MADLQLLIQQLAQGKIDLQNHIVALANAQAAPAAVARKKVVARLEHRYTRRSQVRDPYPYPWDTHYPNTSVGLHMGTDPQMRVAV